MYTEMCAAGGGFDNLLQPLGGAGSATAVEMLRGLVASLEVAVDFAAALSGALPVLTQLLASSSVTDVQARPSATALTSSQRALKCLLQLPHLQSRRNLERPVIMGLQMGRSGWH